MHDEHDGEIQIECGDGEIMRQASRTVVIHLTSNLVHH